MGRNKKSGSTIRRLRKDPGVPKLPHLKFKMDMKKDSYTSVQKYHIDAIGGCMETAPEQSLAALASTAANATDFAFHQTTGERGMDHAKRQYIRTLYKVIEQSDVIIIVLDARDPEGCRAKLVEDEVRRRESEGKKLVFVLNKIDLISQENAMAWLRYLRHTAPTVPFRSSTQHQSANLKSRSAPGLLNLIKSYRNTPAAKITVGVVGYPNVGKSSLINSLKRSKACAVAAEAGWTRDLQSVQIDRGVRIIDSPGVVFDDADPESAKARSGILLRNVLKVEDIDDPLAIVEEVVKRTSKETLQKTYKLPEWNSTMEFVTMVALTTGKLLKGGTPDSLGAARSILQDWNNNKIQYFSIPPAVHSSSLPSTIPGAEDVGQLSIVQGGFGAAFDLGELYGEAMREDNAENDITEGDGSMMSDDIDQVIPHRDEPSLTPDFRNNKQQTQPFFGTKRNLHIASESASGIAANIRPKRVKPTYEIALDTHTQSTLSTSNPLGRRNVRVSLKKGRKAARRATGATPDGMVIDGDT